MVARYVTGNLWHIVIHWKDFISLAKSFFCVVVFARGSIWPKRNLPGGPFKYQIRLFILKTCKDPCEIGNWNILNDLQFSMRLGSSAVETTVQFQGDWKSKSLGKITMRHLMRYRCRCISTSYQWNSVRTVGQNEAKMKLMWRNCNDWLSYAGSAIYA